MPLCVQLQMHWRCHNVIMMSHNVVTITQPCSQAHFCAPLGERAEESLGTRLTMTYCPYVPFSSPTNISSSSFSSSSISSSGKPEISATALDPRLFNICFRKWLGPRWSKGENAEKSGSQRSEWAHSELNVDKWNDNCEAKSEAKGPRPSRGLQVDLSFARNVSYAVR